MSSTDFRRYVRMNMIRYPFLKVSGFVFSVFIARSLGPEELGVFRSPMALALSLVMFSGLGLSKVLVKSNASKKYSDAEKQSIRLVAIMFQVALLILGMIALILLGRIELKMSLVVGLGALGVLVTDTSKSLLIGNVDAKKMFRLSLLTIILPNMLAVLGVKFFSFDGNAIYSFYVFGQTLLGVYSLKFLGLTGVELPLKSGYNLLKKLFRYQWTTYVNLLANKLVWSFAGLVLLSKLFKLETNDIGILAVYFTVLNFAIEIVLLPTNEMHIPFFNKSNLASKKTYVRAVTISVTLSSMLAVLLLQSIGYPLFLGIYGNEYLESFRLIKDYGSILLLFSSYRVINSFLRESGHYIFINLMLMICAVGFVITASFVNLLKFNIVDNVVGLFVLSRSIYYVVLTVFYAEKYGERRLYLELFIVFSVIVFYCLTGVWYYCILALIIIAVSNRNVLTSLYAKMVASIKA